MAIGFGLVAAVVLALQAASSVAERSAPAQATTLNPLNGMAAEQAAFRRFTELSDDDVTKLASSAQAVRADALSAYQSEPLTPKALAVLALATADAEARGKIFELATRLNRRDLALQLAALDHKIKAEDAIGSITTLDQLLRVHPEESARLFPPLQQALLDTRTQGTFAALLDGSAPWHERFAMTAVRNEDARLRLAAIREDIVVEDEDFDRQLIAGLAAQGELERARAMYGLVAQKETQGKRQANTLPWRGDFPPFDWGFVDRRDIRANPNSAGDDLEVFVRPGQGGVIAQRLLTRSELKDELAIRIESTRPIISGRMRASLYCGTAEEPVAQIDLSKGDNALEIPELDAETCAALRLELYARAYRGEPVLRARIGRIRLD